MKALNRRRWEQIQELETEIDIAKGALQKAVEALENECACPGEVDWKCGTPILCDAHEALATIAAELVGASTSPAGAKKRVKE